MSKSFFTLYKNTSENYKPQTVHCHSAKNFDLLVRKPIKKQWRQDVIREKIDLVSLKLPIKGEAVKNGPTADKKASRAYTNGKAPAQFASHASDQGFAVSPISLTRSLYYESEQRRSWPD